MTLETLVDELNESAGSLTRLGPDAELQIVLEDELGTEIRRYEVNRILPTSKGNLVFVVDV